MPYNITTGFDDNGDTNSNDRPAGVRRNSARGAGQLDVSTRMSWQRGFGKRDQSGPGGGVMVSQRIGPGGPGGPSGGGGPMMSIGGGPGGEQKRYHLEFYLQAYNLFNQTNPFNFSGVLTSPFFGKATAAHSGRRIETGIRFSF
jgi:hypothetical protein